MAGIDSSIYQNQADPMSALSNGLKLGEMIHDRRKQNQINDVISQNVGADGKLNTVGAISGLYKVDPEKAMALQQQTTQQQLEQQKLKREKLTQDVTMTSQLLGGVKDQPTYEAALNQAKQYGIDGVDQLPPTYDPGMVESLKNRALTIQDRLAQQNKDKEFGLKEKEVGAKIEENHLKQREMDTNKQNLMANSADNLLESARGELKQPLADYYAAEKFKSLYGLYGNPDKLSPQQVNFANEEAGKIATGGVPTVDQLRGQQNGAIPEALAKLAQAVKNSPSPANQGAFLKAQKDYVDSIQNDAQKIILDRYGRVLNSKRQAMGDDNYKVRADQYLNRFKRAEELDALAKAPPPGSTVVHDDGTKWKFNGGDPSDKHSWSKM